MTSPSRNLEWITFEVFMLNVKGRKNQVYIPDIKFFILIPFLHIGD